MVDRRPPLRPMPARHRRADGTSVRALRSDSPLDMLAVKSIASVLVCIVLLPLVTSCGDEDTAASSSSVPQVEPGDCIADIGPFTETGGLRGLEVVDCAQRHEAEVYGTAELADASYPGRDAVQQEMISTCDARYEEYPGAPESGLVQTAFIPSEAEWDDGIQTIVCFLEDPNGRTGSVAE